MYVSSFTFIFMYAWCYMCAFYNKRKILCVVTDVCYFMCVIFMSYGRIITYFMQLMLHVVQNRLKIFF